MGFPHLRFLEPGSIPAASTIFSMGSGSSCSKLRPSEYTRAEDGIVPIVLGQKGPVARRVLGQEAEDRLAGAQEMRGGPRISGRHAVRSRSEAEPSAEVAAIRDRGLLDGDPRTVCGARVELEHGGHRRHVNHSRVSDVLDESFSRVGRATRIDGHRGIHEGEDGLPVCHAPVTGCGADNFDIDIGVGCFATRTE